MTTPIRKTRRVWAYLTCAMNTHGVVQASRRELAESLGFKSSSTLIYHLYRLRDAGHITWDDGKARQIAVVVPLFERGVL